MERKTAWERVKEILREKGLSESDITNVYEAISDVCGERGVRFIRI